MGWADCRLPRAAACLAIAMLVFHGGARTALAGPADPVDVVFAVNDALVKNRFLEGVDVSVFAKRDSPAVLTGSTDAQGRLAARLRPGTYSASFIRVGYVPVLDLQTTVHTAGQVITVTLSPSLESEGAPPDHRRIRIILNWGSLRAQAKDVDSHIACPCRSSDRHVYFGHKLHTGTYHSVALDVDDMDWGGPETITLATPPPGRYEYWVHKFSSGGEPLGRSDVVVRVLVGDSGMRTYTAPRTLTSREWRPFKALVVGEDLVPRIEDFSPEETSRGLPDRAPSGYEDPFGDLWIIAILVAGLLGIAFIVIRAIVRAARRRG